MVETGTVISGVRLVASIAQWVRGLWVKPDWSAIQAEFDGVRGPIEGLWTRNGADAPATWTLTHRSPAEVRDRQHFEAVAIKAAARLPKPTIPQEPLGHFELRDLIERRLD